MKGAYMRKVEVRFEDDYRGDHLNSEFCIFTVSEGEISRKQIAEIRNLGWLFGEIMTSALDRAWVKITLWSNVEWDGLTKKIKSILEVGEVETQKTLT